jgi:hypothetical protein
MPEMIRLLAQRDGSVRAVLPPGRDAAGWHQALAAEVAQHLTPAHAAILAAPVRGDGTTVWYAPGTAMRRFADLDAEDRGKLTAAAGSILSDIRRLAESGTAPAVAAAWPALRTIPDLTHLFAVDGRPVLAGWGSGAPVGGDGPLVGFDDGVPWRRPPSTPWPVYAASLLGLAALGLFAGLLLAPLLGLFLPAPNACQAAPGQLALLLEQSRQAARGDALRQDLAALSEDHGNRALQCPIPRVEVPAPRPAPPPPPPPPQHRADLPQDRWDHHDLGMLQGCWNNFTHMTLYGPDPRTRAIRPKPVQTWLFCFDGHGHGHQQIRLQNGETCENDLTASFGSDNSLQMVDSGHCPFPSAPLVRGRLTCRRESDSEAACVRRDLEGSSAGVEQHGRFRKAPSSGPTGGGHGGG